MESRKKAIALKVPSVMAHEEAHLFRGSSRVQRAWYDPAARKVTAQFPDGVRWAYYGVDARTWADFIEAPSPGRFVREVLEQHQNGPAGRR